MNCQTARRIRVDWFRITIEIERSGYSVENIAAAIGVARSTLLGWRNFPFHEPRHADGERLVSLWCRVMQKPRDALPLNVDDLMSAFKASSKR